MLLYRRDINNEQLDRMMLLSGPYSVSGQVPQLQTLSQGSQQ